MIPATDSDHDISSKQARFLAKRWVWIVLAAELFVFYVPSLIGALFFSVVGYSHAPSFSWENMQLDLFVLILAPLQAGWAFYVYAYSAWKKISRARAEIGEILRDVKKGLVRLSVFYVIVNFFFIPFAELGGQGAAMWYLFFFPPIALLIAKNWSRPSNKQS